MQYPYVALCGWPTAGKSTIQRLLEVRYGYQPQDDGRVLRDAAKVLYGLTDWHVSTQAGKLSTVDVCGQTWTVRKLLGELGNLLEGQHGEFFMPQATLRDCLAPYGVTLGAPVPADVSVPKMSFGSVRKLQGLYWKEVGSLVIEVVRPELPEPEHAFDRYTPDAIMVTIHNDRPGIDAFEARAIEVLDPILLPTV